MPIRGSMATLATLNSFGVLGAGAGCGGGGVGGVHRMGFGGRQLLNAQKKLFFWVGYGGQF